MKINSIKIPENPGRYLTVYLVLLILGATISIFAEDVIKVTAQVDKSVITIGDRITYSLVIAHDETIKIEQPGPGANRGQFEIKDYTIHDPVK